MSGSRFIKTAVGRLKVTTAGRGAPAVLWHSLFVDERSWQRLAAELAKDRQLVLVTGPGHGESGDLGRRYDLLQCARATVEVLDALGVAEPVDWVGNAWGGHVGIRFATAYPSRVRSLVTIGTPVQALTTSERVRTRTLLLVHQLLGPAGFLVDAVVETLLSPQTRASDTDAVQLVRRSFVEAAPGQLRNAVASISLHREDLTALLPGITIPTLMITGEQHSGWTPTQSAGAVATMPDGRAAAVADAAYLVPLERPEAVLELLRAFWATALAETSKVLE
ncbi:alpha/beta fold hydrolase [Pedococcus ginsenosidimutans]|uniref:Alpha/beta fold hydrolase n=1 Tax=Pedococcus ginsenosidimutans TaxID=490570 RepID=A0ABP8YGQ7_9MICO